MNRKKMARAGITALLCVFLSATAGCGSVSAIDVTTIVLNDDGSVTSVVVEDFEADYYDVEELKAQVEEEAGAYNLRQGEDRVKLSECKADKGTVRLVMEYMAPEDYAAFNRVVLQVEGNQVTVSESVHVRTAKKIASASDGVELIGEKEAFIGEAAVLPAMITMEE
ncbi:MAG: hypothetical protein IJR58_08695 [Lachnospiraceae bacterium]|nr:hypothetical protein [Lachnospiraceae bacterium]